VIQALRSRWSTASAATLLYWLSASMLMAFVPIRMAELGHTDLEIGIAVAGRSLLPFLFAMAAGQLSDKVGGRRMLVPSAVIMAAIGPLQAVATQPWQFTVIQAAFGTATIGVWLSLQSVVTYAGTGTTLKGNLALFSLAWGAGVALGPAVGAWVYATGGFAALCWAFAGSTLLILPAALAIPWHVADEARAAAPPRERFRTALVGLVERPAIRAVLLSSFVTHYINSIRQSFYPVLLERNGFSVSQIGLLLSVMGFASLGIRVFMPALTRLYDSSRVLVWSTLAGVVAISVTPALGDLRLLVPAAVLIGFQMGLNPPITVELMARFSSATERGLAAGMRTTVNRLAQTSQPLIFGGMAAVIGLGAAFSASFAILSGLSYGVARSIRHVRAEGTV
jgi:MFS family permease